MEGIEKNNSNRSVANNNGEHILSESQSLQSFSSGGLSGYVVAEPEEYTTLEDLQEKINTLHLQHDLKDKRSFQVALLKALMKQIAGLPEKDRPLAAKHIQQTIRQAGLSAEFPDYFSKLPFEIIEIIFKDSALELKDLCNISETSRRNCQIVEKMPKRAMRKLVDKHTAETEKSIEAYRKETKYIQENLKHISSLQVALLNALRERIAGLPEKDRPLALKLIQQTIRQAGLSAEFPDYLSKLPFEIIEIIFKDDGLGPRDRYSFSKTSKGHYQLTKEIRLKDKHTEEAENITSWEAYQKKIKDIQKDLKDYPSFQVVPFNALVKQIQEVGKPREHRARLTAFKAVVDAIVALPPKHRVDLDLVKQINQQIKACSLNHSSPMENKEWAERIFKEFFQATQQSKLHEAHLAELLAIFAEWIQKLPEDTRWDAFNQLLTATQQIPREHRVQPLTQLPKQIPTLQTKEERDMAFEIIWQAILEAVDGFPIGVRNKPFKAVIKQIEKVPAKERAGRFHDVLSRIKDRPAQYSPRLLEPLSKQIENLPLDAQWHAFKRAWQTILYYLPEGNVSNAVPSEKLLNALSYIPMPEFLDLNEDSAKQINDEVKKIAGLPSNEQWHAFKRAWQTILYRLTESNVVPSEDVLKLLSYIVRKVVKAIPENRGLGAARAEILT